MENTFDFDLEFNFAVFCVHVFSKIAVRATLLTNKTEGDIVLFTSLYSFDSFIQVSFAWRCYFR